MAPPGPGAGAHGPPGGAWGRVPCGRGGQCPCLAEGGHPSRCVWQPSLRGPQVSRELRQQHRRVRRPPSSPRTATRAEFAARLQAGGVLSGPLAWPPGLGLSACLSPAPKGLAHAQSHLGPHLRPKDSESRRRFLEAWPAPRSRPRCGVQSSHWSWMTSTFSPAPRCGASPARPPPQLPSCSGPGQGVPPDRLPRSLSPCWSLAGSPSDAAWTWSCSPEPRVAPPRTPRGERRAWLGRLHVRRMEQGPQSLSSCPYKSSGKLSHHLHILRSTST